MTIAYVHINLPLHIEMLCDWHQDHAAINFPDSKYKRTLFKEKLIKEANLPKTTMRLIKVDGKIAGWWWTVVSRDVYKDIQFAELRYIHLLPEFRGNGIGKLVLADIDNHVRQLGAEEIRLGTDANNIQSIKAYEGTGYKIKRVLMEKKL